MIALPAGVTVWLAAGATDMRKGFDGLAALIQTQLTEDPFSGQLFVFRGRAGQTRLPIPWRAIHRPPNRRGASSLRRG